jgi:hypothetical protein
MRRLPELTAWRSMQLFVTVKLAVAPLPRLTTWIRVAAQTGASCSLVLTAGGGGEGVTTSAANWRCLAQNPQHAQRRNAR